MSTLNASAGCCGSQILQTLTEGSFRYQLHHTAPYCPILHHRYCRALEEGSFRGRSGDFFWMLFLGSLMMLLIAVLLPWYVVWCSGVGGAVVLRVQWCLLLLAVLLSWSAHIEQQQQQSLCFRMHLKCMCVLMGFYRARPSIHCVMLLAHTSLLL